MKILLIKNFVSNTDTLEKGLVLVKTNLNTIGLSVDITEEITTNQFTSVPIQNASILNGYIVNPTEIFTVAKSFGVDFDVDILIYDSTKITPQPTNPADSGTNIQIPEQWYDIYPEVFAEFFYHELCHFLFQVAQTPDTTHQYVSGFNTRTEYYLYLIKSLIPAWNTYVNSITPPMLTILKLGSKGEAVKTLQNNLNRFGSKLVVDGDFGKKTQQAVREFQAKYNMQIDGVAGSITQGAFSIIDTITQVCGKNAVEAILGVSVASCESGLNPKATFFNPPSNSTDRGLFMWNSIFHKEITDTQAFDVTTATQLFCEAVKEGDLHNFWSASQKCWQKKLPPELVVKYKL